MDTTAEGNAGNPGAVVTSEDGKEVTGASALETTKPTEEKTRMKTKLPLPTSIVEENKIKRQQQRKLKPPSIKINEKSNQEQKQNDENKMKQPSIK